MMAGCAGQLSTWRPRETVPRLGDSVRMWTERVTLPTYDVAPDPVPRFQVTDGVKFYPYPAQHNIATEATPRLWTLVCMENEYLVVKVMPQLGGRVYTIYDKLCGKDVVYRPTVIKPTTAGIRGAWICGGIEYNFPDCHTVTTHDDVHWTTRQYADGSAAVLIGDVERISHMSWSVEFRLYPGRACLEDHVNLYNRTPMRQRYFYWTNACVEGNDRTQVIFPFSKVFTGNRRARLLDWPVRDGIDYSYCRNYDGGTSVGGFGGEEDFFGSFDHGTGAGLAYYGDHQSLPARKFWTWGTGTQGKHWAKLVSDDKRPYLELQAGPAITSSEFAWLQPYESRDFQECWIPVSRIGPYSFANRQAVVRLSLAAHHATVGVLPLQEMNDAQVRLLSGVRVLHTWRGDLGPPQPLLATLDVGEATDLRVVVYDSQGRLVAEYALGKYTADPAAPKRVPNENPRRVNASTPAGAAHRFELSWLDSRYADAANLIERAVAKWPDDPQVRLEAGIFRLFQALPDKAAELLEPVARAGQGQGRGATDAETRRRGDTETKDNSSGTAVPPNGGHSLPYGDAGSADACYYLALAKMEVGDLTHALHLLGEVQKTAAGQPESETWMRAARILRARLLLRAGRFHEALDPLMAQLRIRPSDPYVAALAAYASRQEKGCEAAYRVVRQYLAEPDTEPMARLESQLAEGQPDATLQRMLLRDPEVAIDLACDYMGIGDYTAAGAILDGDLGETATNAMTWLLAAWCDDQLGQHDVAADLRARAAQEPVEFVLPSRPEELAAAEACLRGGRKDAHAAYYAGLVLMRLMRYGEAETCWQRAIGWQDNNPLARRCLGVVTATRDHEPNQAVAHLERAIELDPTQPTFYRDLAKIHTGARRYDEARQVLERGAGAARPDDPLLADLISTDTAIGQYNEATAIFRAHRFRGPEPLNNLVEDYVIAWLGQGLNALQHDRPQQALDDFDTAAHIPDDPPFDGAEDVPGASMIPFWRGIALRQLGRVEPARQAFKQASQTGVDEQVLRRGYSGVLDTVHAMLAMRLLGDDAGYRQQQANLTDRLAQLKRWERSDWAKGFVAFVRAWADVAVANGAAVEWEPVKAVMADPRVEPRWGQLSTRLARVLPACEILRAATPPKVASKPGVTPGS